MNNSIRKTLNDLVKTHDLQGGVYFNRGLLKEFFMFDLENGEMVAAENLFLFLLPPGHLEVWMTSFPSFKTWNKRPARTSRLKISLPNIQLPRFNNPAIRVTFQFREDFSSIRVSSGGGYQDYYGEGKVILFCYVWKFVKPFFAKVYNNLEIEKVDFVEFFLKRDALLQKHKISLQLTKTSAEM